MRAAAWRSAARHVVLQRDDARLLVNAAVLQRERRSFGLCGKERNAFAEQRRNDGRVDAVYAVPRCVRKGRGDAIPQNCAWTDFKPENEDGRYDA
jgi:hypothetical protein